MKNKELKQTETAAVFELRGAMEESGWKIFLEVKEEEVLSKVMRGGPVVV